MLLRQTIAYLPAQIMGPLMQLLAALAWTHWLTPAPYGVLAYLIASQDLLFLICMSWWTHYTMRYLGELSGPDGVTFLRAESTIFAWMFVLQIAGTALVFGLLREPVTNLEFIAAAAYTCTRSLLNHLGERARARRAIGVYTLGQFFGSILGFVAAYAALRCIAPTLEAVLFGFAIAQTLGIVAMIGRLGIVRGNLLPPASMLRTALRYGAPLLLAGGLAWLAQNGIRFVIEWTEGPDALGLLAVGWGLGMRLSATLAMLVIAASFPLAVQSLKKGTREEAYAHLSSGGILLCGLIVPSSIGICFVAVPFTTLFVAEQFRTVTMDILPYAAVTGAVRNIRMHIADPIFLLVEQPRISTILTFADAFLVMAGCALGAWIDGLMGAVVASLVATTISALLGFLLAYKIGAFHFAYMDGLRIVIAGMTMAVGLALVPWADLFPHNAARLVLESATGAIFYGVAIAALYPDRTIALRRMCKLRVVAQRNTG